MLNLVDLRADMEEFIANHPMNTVAEPNIPRIFEAPLLAVASAEDPLFAELKQAAVVGPHHRSPQEWLADGKVVVSYFLPFSSVVREANAKPGYPALEWVYARYEGEQVNEALRGYLELYFQQRDMDAISPPLDDAFAIEERRANWSERHVAYIAGLGTFGLHTSFITKAGCAGRFGSVVVDADLPVTTREYSNIYEYCTMCGQCIKRCPTGAITKDGKDHRICADYMSKEISPKFKPRYGCGKCQTAVCCETKIP